MTPPLLVIDGSTPVVLVAPHGGRRDPRRRPWAGGGLRMNDLHTASLTEELAACTGAAAVVNATHDRNDVDLNRIADAHAAAPDFLAAIADRLDAAVARHGRATLLTVHGWNVVQTAVDVGIGATPGADPLAVPPTAAVSAAFAASTLRHLVAACTAAGIDATLGARYPARHRENLIQLFTTRHRGDARPLVRRLAALAPRVDALQLELAIPLRWPGPWRARLVAALAAALAAPDGAPPPGATAPAVATDVAVRRLQLVTPAVSGLVALDAGARLLIFPPGGGLALFTGERTGGEPADAVGPLRMSRARSGGLAVRFRGPLLRFPDTTPFLDLEAGLARASLSAADVALDFVPAHEAPAGGDFGSVAGSVVLDGERLPIAGHGFAEEGPGDARWPRLRAALRIAPDASLALTVGLDGTGATGFVCRRGRHDAVVSARPVVGGDAGPLGRVVLDVVLASGAAVRVEAASTVSLPVVRGRGPRPVRIDFAACRLDGGREPAGWCELGGHRIGTPDPAEEQIA